MADASVVLADLRDESAELDALVAGLPPERWAAPTPAPGWTIAHQIGHLLWTDRQVLLAVTDPETFRKTAERALTLTESFVDEGAAREIRVPPAELLARWRTTREEMWRALAAMPEGDRLPWYATRMSAASMASGRLMETWAHGLDVADALGVTREPTARLRHIARLGVRARDYAYMARGLTPPQEEFRVELRAPDGGTWAFGPEDAAQTVTGDALGFCLLATQRAHRADVDVQARGADAEQWLGIAQAFAGPPGPGREPGQGVLTATDDRPGQAEAGGSPD
ncbi:TIGR03084 family metal-binding protein [Streptomyces sp. NPDC003077]|uniref:TIGR03084 family metal-binding protein n=1 Tax=Streptomyces sp. NPDC003077 TaxID=3154443 RepID=UPI0033AFC0E6